MQLVGDQTRDTRKNTAVEQPELQAAKQRRDLKRIATSSVLLASLALVSQFTTLLRTATHSYFFGGVPAD